MRSGVPSSRESGSSLGAMLLGTLTCESLQQGGSLSSRPGTIALHIATPRIGPLITSAYHHRPGVSMTKHPKLQMSPWLGQALVGSHFRFTGWQYKGPTHASVLLPQ